MGGLAFPNIDAAIAKFEGFGDPSNVATKNNNPGNLVYGQFSILHGASGSAGDFAVFPTVAAGTAAEDSLVSYYANQGFTIGQLVNTWAPPTAKGNTPQGTQSYVDFLANSLGASPSTPISAAESGASQGGNTSAGSGIGSLIGGLLNNTSPLAPLGFTWTRIAAFIVGILVIGAGLLLFRPIGESVQVAVKHAAKATAV